jgi:hypothetical protein
MLIPILGKELASVTPYPLEDLRYLSAVELKKQPQACATIARTDLASKPQMVKILTVPDYPFDEKMVRAVNIRSQRATPTVYLSIAETAQQIEQRQQALRALPAPAAGEEDGIVVDDQTEALAVEIKSAPKEGAEAKEPLIEKAPSFTRTSKIK